MSVMALDSTTGLRRPAYAVGAVDHTLVAIDLLAARPTIRLTELAAELHVGRATAHRLLQMMVYRGFAVQNGDRSYAAGPALARRSADALPDGPEVAEWLRPHLQSLSQALGETVHVEILVGIEAVTVSSVRGVHPLSAPDPAGARVPAEASAGGLAMLATMSEEGLRHSYAGRPGPSMANLERSLAVARQSGFGVIIGEDPRSWTAVSRHVVDDRGRTVAAIGSTASAGRMGRAQIVRTASLLRAAADKALRDGSLGLTSPAPAS